MLMPKFGTCSSLNPILANFLVHALKSTKHGRWPLFGIVSSFRSPNVASLRTLPGLECSIFFLGAASFMLNEDVILN